MLAQETEAQSGSAAKCQGVDFRLVETAGFALGP
jgi:hypothetical protein